MTRLEGELTLMRVFLGENDRWEHRPLYEAVVETLRREGVAGATVLRGVMGFGARSITHTDRLLRFSNDLPIVIEVVERQAKIDAVLPLLDDMLSSAMITLERAHVIRYTP